MNKERQRIDTITDHKGSTVDSTGRIQIERPVYFLHRTQPSD